MLSCLYLLFIVLIVLFPMSVLLNYIITLFYTLVWFPLSGVTSNVLFVFVLTAVYSSVLSSNLCIIKLKDNSVILGIAIVKYKYRGYVSFRSDRILKENTDIM